MTYSFEGISEGRNGPSPFSFTAPAPAAPNPNPNPNPSSESSHSNSDDNKQRLAKVKDEQKSEFDRKLSKLTSTKSGDLIDWFSWKWCLIDGRTDSSIAAVAGSSKIEPLSSSAAVGSATSVRASLDSESGSLSVLNNKQSLDGFTISIYLIDNILR